MTKMYIDYAVVKQALEFVTSEAWGTTPYMDGRVYEDAARLRDVLQAALRTTLAQQDEPVEPVAKVELMMTGGNAGLATRIVEIEDHLRERLRPGQLLYTAPPQRKLAPLTEEEIYHATGHCGVSKYTAINITRAVEQVHGIKE